MTLYLKNIIIIITKDLKFFYCSATFQSAYIVLLIVFFKCAFLKLFKFLKLLFNFDSLLCGMFEHIKTKQWNHAVFSFIKYSKK